MSGLTNGSEGYMLHPTWSALSVLTVVGGVLVILAPKFVVTANKQLNRALISLDDLVIRHRHLVGVALLIVGYLCFRLALLGPSQLP